jgi:hypothetical protein
MSVLTPSVIRGDRNAGLLFAVSRHGPHCS